MTSAIAETVVETAAYSSLIHKAFIEPIRTVSIIDDDYPSLDAMLSELREEKSDSWKPQDIVRLQHMLEMCRAQSRSWSVDVHDAKNINVDGTIPSYLNHSDLIFLDYHLFQGDDGGQIARPIIKELATNNHFNLVVVHTSGIDGKIRPVFEQILFELLGPEEILPNGKAYSDVDDAIEALALDEELTETMDKACDRLKAQELLSKNDSDLEEFKSIFAPFDSDIDNELEEGISKEEVYWWILASKFKKEEFIGNKHGVTSFNWTGEEESNWISTGKVFVTVVKKSSAQDSEYLTSKLSLALQEAKPSPLLLMMARMRFELEENGLLEATKISQQKDLQAGWMSQLLKSELESRHIICGQILDKHWERMSKEANQRLSEYSNEIVDAFPGDQKTSLRQLFGDKVLKRTNEIVAELNCYSCTRDISSHHLSTGHVIRFSEEEASIEYWLCLTPACDLVPGQKSEGWFKRLNVNNMPFKAVRLTSVTINKANGGATDNNYLWLNIDGSIEAFKYPSAGKIPEWEQMFAKDSGIFQNNQLTISRVKSNDGELAISSEKATVVAELRYEYALNLLHRLGASLSRVGLDFVKGL